MNEEIEEMVGEFLVNTNIWLWHLHDLLPEKERQKFQPPAGKNKEEVLQEVEEFLFEAWEHVRISDFSLHTLGVLLFRLGLHELFLRLTNQLADKVVKLETSDLKCLAEVSQKFAIDFDDAYQYVIAEKYGLTVVSFDPDFDRTDRGRLTPEQALQKLRRR